MSGPSGATSGDGAVSRDGATSDSLDTAAYVLGPARGLALVEATEGAAALIVRSNQVRTETFVSERLKEFLIDRPGQAPDLPATRP